MCAALLLVPAGRLAAQEATAAGDEKPWSVDVGIDWADRYLFRGVLLTGDDQPVLAANATLTIGNFSVWSDAYRGDFDGDAGEGDFTEIDFGADYTFSAGNFSLTVGVVTYLYPNEVEAGLGFSDSTELGAAVAWKTLLSPSVSYQRDVDRVDGGFLRIGIEHSFAISDSVSLDWSGALGIDNEYNGDEAFALNDVLLGLDVPWQVTDAFSLHVMVEQSIALEALEDIGVDDETVFTVGAGLSF